MRNTFLYIRILLMLFPIMLKAQNPVSPPGIYLADPSARVFNGKLYVYGSIDESTDYYCSVRHHALSTFNMQNWTLHKDIFASKGPNDKVPYSDSVLYAPDCIYANGKYYLYYNLPHPGYIEGVAVGDSPLGEFSEGKLIDVYGYDQIDPAVFIDDDGTAYYIWGQFNAKMARLNPDMMSIDSSTIRDSVLTEKEHYFHEGGTMIKRNGIYYFIYAHLGRAHRPTSIGYSTSSSPMGPYKHGGIIIDNDHCDPGVWNNHGSLVEFQDQWYVFYHRSTHGSVMMRKACVEPVFFNEDGSIPEVEMTSQGAGPPLSANDFIEAERACLLHGNVRIEKIEDNNEALRKIQNGDRVVYKYVNFRGGLKNFSIRVSPGKGESTIRFSIDSPWNPPIAKLKIPSFEDSGEWMSFFGEVDAISGTHALWMSFELDEGDNIDVDWFRFQ